MLIQVMSQCCAATKDGSKCKRQAIPGRRYCWQHESTRFKKFTTAGVIGVALTVIGFAADMAGLWSFFTTAPSSQIGVQQGQNASIVIAESDNKIAGENNNILNHDGRNNINNQGDNATNIGEIHGDVTINSSLPKAKDEECQNSLINIIDQQFLHEPSTNKYEFEYQVEKIASVIIDGVKNYLWFCLDQSQPIAGQIGALPIRLQTQLTAIGLLAVTGKTPIVQLIDPDNDGQQELLLHMWVTYCPDGYDAVSIFFFRNNNEPVWRGKSIWNCSGSTEPDVILLPFTNSSNEKFLFIKGEGHGADHAQITLQIYAWSTKLVYLWDEIVLSTWCLQPMDWEISNSGEIYIPPAEQTERCQARRGRFYHMQNGEFVVTYSPE